MVSGDLKIVDPTSSVAVILVEPADARNVGAVARAMSNLGFTDLRLVSPTSYRRDVAEKVACWGSDLLATAKIYDDLATALSDRHEVAGFTSLHFKHRGDPLPLREWLNGTGSPSKAHMALVFGPEDTGLRKEHLPMCQTLVRIPSVAENRSFNLAQAVLLVLFSLVETRTVFEAHQPLATTSDQLARIGSLVMRIAEMVGYVDESSRPHLPDTIMNLCLRTRATPAEAAAIIGFFGKIERAITGRVPIRRLGNVS